MSGQVLAEAKALQEKRQHFMEMAVMGVVAQGGPSRDPGNRYTAPDGRHCHIGHFAPDLPEGRRIPDHLYREPKLPFSELGASFLDSLQQVHDRTNPWSWDKYSDRLEEFCDCYGLRYPGELL